MTSYEPLDWYENALYYDIIFDADTAAEADFLEAAMARHARTRAKTVLEPACGSGRLLVALAERGYTVSGFDASPGMLDFARQRLAERGLAGRVFEARMESFTSRGGFGMAHCLVSTFKYLLEEEHAQAHLERVHDALAPGGIYVLGLHLTDYADRGGDTERWIGKRDGVHVTCDIDGWPPNRKTRTERVRSRLRVREGRTTRRFETEWTFRTYGPRQLRSLLAKVPGFEHVETYDFGFDDPVKFGGESLDTVLILRKRGYGAGRHVR